MEPDRAANSGDNLTAARDYLTRAAMQLDQASTRREAVPSQVLGQPYLRGAMTTASRQPRVPLSSLPSTSSQVPLRPIHASNYSPSTPSISTTYRQTQQMSSSLVLAGQASSSSNAFRRTQRPSWMQERHNLFGKKKTKKVKLSMWEHEFICLSSTSRITPPSPMDKALLIRAGLGPRKLSLFEYGESFEFHDSIMNAFPRLSEGGGYELLRTKQNTNRELCVIPPPPGGYTVEYLKNMVSQAKIYIRPIQKDLPLTPLIEEKNDVYSAPSEECMHCLNKIPMHQLRQHLKDCPRKLVDQKNDKSGQREGSPSSHESTPSPNFPVFLCGSAPSNPGHSTSSTCISPPRSPVAPPYSPITPDPHSAESESRVIDLTQVEEMMVSEAIKESLSTSHGEDISHKEPTTSADIIWLLQKECGLKIPTSEEEWGEIPRTTIDIHRTMVVKDGLREARKSRFHTTKLLNVRFVFEPAIDTGGLSREFWRLFAKGVDNTYCIGDSKRRIFSKNVPALQIDSAETDEALRFLFSEENVNKGENDTLIIETGYRKPLCRLTMEDVPGLKQTLRDHVLVKVKAELDQFCEGLKTLGVLEKMRKYPSLMAPLFTDSGKKELNKQYFKDLLTPVYSVNNPVRRTKEEAAFIFFMDFLEECEDGTVIAENDEPVTLEDILIFFTGSDHEPPLGFHPKPTLKFSDQDLATAGTCEMGFCLPIKHDQYEIFKEKLMLSLLGHDGFGKT